MSRLLINTPTGGQELIEVGEGGGYFDASRVLWDERIDGHLPEITLGGMVRLADELVFDASLMTEQVAAQQAAAYAASIPQKVSRAQFILALLAIGLLDEAEAAIEQADRATQINYRERLEFERGHPLIATMALVMGKTDAEIDALFALAASL